MTTRVALRRRQAGGDHGLRSVVGALVASSSNRIRGLAMIALRDQQPLPLPARDPAPPSITIVCMPIGIWRMSSSSPELRRRFPGVVERVRRRTDDVLVDAAGIACRPGARRPSAGAPPAGRARPGPGHRGGCFRSPETRSRAAVAAWWTCRSPMRPTRATNSPGRARKEILEDERCVGGIAERDLAELDVAAQLTRVAGPHRPRAA